MPVATRPTSPASSHPLADLWLPGLVHRPATRSRLGHPAHLHSAAAVALSLRLDAVITASGRALSREDIGKTGISIRRAWDEAAGNLIALATRDGTIPVTLTPAPAWTGTGWFELSIGSTKATSWLAHPRTFTTVNDFLAARLGGLPHYLVADPGASTLLVSGGRAGELNAGSEDVVVYQAGFPVPSPVAGSPGVAGATFLLAS